MNDKCFAPGSFDAGTPAGFIARATAAVALAAAGGGVSLAAATATAAPSSVQSGIEELADGVYLYTDSTHRSLFVVTDDGVLLTDPQGAEDTAERYLAAVRTISEAPVRYVVYSHHHGDHIGGGAAFGDEPIFIAHDSVSGHVEEGDGIVAPEITFSSTMSLHLGDLEVRLVYPGPSESDSNIVIHVPERRVAFMADTAAVRTLPWGALRGAEPRAWIAALRRIAELDFDILAPGHGATGRKEHALEFLGYMTELTESVAAAIERGETLEETQASVRMPAYAEWERYDEHVALNVEGVYRELTNR